MIAIEGPWLLTEMLQSDTVNSELGINENEYILEPVRVRIDDIVRYNANRPYGQPDSDPLAYIVLRGSYGEEGFLVNVPFDVFDDYMRHYS